jgi:peptide/nickel transport system substrate-binding protein
MNGLAVLLAMATSAVLAQGASAPAGEIDRSATLRFVWQAAPAAYDPPFSKNQYQEMGYYLPIYDSLVRLDAKGNIIPSVATSWTTSSDGMTLTMKLRPGMQFTDGSDVNAAAVVRSLTRTKKDPSSLIAGQLGSFASFEALDPSTVVIHLNTPDANALYTLATSVGMIVSAKALDSGVSLGTAPVGSGPYKLVSSGPQGATYERNENYYDKSQNQLAKVSIAPIGDTTARLNALQTGQVDAAFFEVYQWPQIQVLVRSGKFTVHSVLQPNSFPLWLNTKIKPFDNPKVRMALNLAIDREAINQGIQNGQCPPASQALQPGVIGHDSTIAPYKRDVARAKALLQEAGVGPFSFDAIVTTFEPGASIGVAMKAQLQAIGVTMNIIPVPGPQTRPMFRAGNHGAMLMTLSVPAPDPASIIDAVYMGPDNPGGVTPEFAKAVAAARTKPIGSSEREAAYKAISKMAYEDPRQVFVCWSTILVAARKGVVGIDKEPYLNAVPIPDIRTYGIVKG